MSREFKRTGTLMDMNSYPQWAAELLQRTRDAKRRVLGHEVFARMRDAALSKEETLRFLAAGWPVIEQFPQYMAVNLCKLRFGRSAGEDMARRYLMSNIRVEQKHAEHWLDWAAACGMQKQDLVEATLPAACQALNHWCWHSCERGPLAASIAATNFAIEGVTGEWAGLVCASDAYERSFEPGVRKKAMRWLRLHAEYDDKHPWEALDIVCTLLGEHPEPRCVDLLVRSVANSYGYLSLSLDWCLTGSDEAAFEPEVHVA